ncbi:hypothetical protein Pmani_015123 [Petrolisthes manimaculis]|uniref:Uncharacterized protein n=1 Tax=Petrolisthes manimaculis TaxID=1843537 RepID=A0AAE1UA86_9EUCA|nr:hypothetical protein Pmani_015123 [Petrolisthes manimaculis]
MSLPIFLSLSPPRPARRLPTQSTHPSQHGPSHTMSLKLVQSGVTTTPPRPQFMSLPLSLSLTPSLNQSLSTFVYVRTPFTRDPVPKPVPFLLCTVYVLPPPLPLPLP